MHRSASLLLAVWIVGCSQPNPPASKTASPATAEAPVKITHFYAARAEITRGDTLMLCYGVENAVEVSLEPPVSKVVPSYHRCFYVNPEQSTKYRLTARGRVGDMMTAEVAVKVVPPSPPERAGVSWPLIHFFMPGADQVPAGSQVTLCYSAPEATKLVLDPPVQEVTPSSRFCFSARIDKTTTFALTAYDATGRSETARVTVTAK